jgi:hypothetical protein
VFSQHQTHPPPRFATPSPTASLIAPKKSLPSPFFWQGYSSTLKTEAAGSYESSLTSCHSIPCPIPDDNHYY